MKTIMTILSLIGSLGLFMYGMRVMSEALQKLAGFGLRKKLAVITNNRFKGILSGSFITGIIQSSTATTIMVASFVNAGLLSLLESTSLIMGANIGTTATAWIVSILGFNLRIGMFTLPLIAISLPLIFLQKKNLNYWGEFIIGFALIFIGLDFIKNVFPDVQENAEIFEFVSSLTEYGFASLVIFVGTGFLLTAIIQSSSVTSALTLVLCFKGYINFENAAAMIIGENIGTTVTVNIATIMANNAAKRSALFHFLFNVAGLIWMLPLFSFFTAGIEKLIHFFTGMTPSSSVAYVPIALAIFHSLYNILNTLIIVWFIPQFIFLTEKIIRVKDLEKEQKNLRFLYKGVLSTSELSIVQVKNEISHFGEKSYKMFLVIQKMFSAINKEDFQLAYQKIKVFEEESDKLEEDISIYLSKISEDEISQESSFAVHIMLKLVDELETISDIMFNMAKVLKRRRKNKIWFTQTVRDNLNKMFSLISEALKTMNENLTHDYHDISYDKAYIIEKRINKLRKELYKKHLVQVDDEDYRHEAGVVYNDIYNRCENLGDHIFNVSKTIHDLKNVNSFR